MTAEYLMPLPAAVPQMTSIMEAYERVPLQTGRTAQTPLMSPPGSDNLKPIPATMIKTIVKMMRANPTAARVVEGQEAFCYLPGAPDTLEISSFEKLSSNNWYGDWLIEALAAVATARWNRKRPVEGVTQRGVKFATGCDLRHQQAPLGARRSLVPMLTTFGADATWRSQTTVILANTSIDAHWILLVVFGPERLVIPFDGSGGDLAEGHQQASATWILG
jgi:hypothetical protein